jgi:hypothetical protein
MSWEEFGATVETLIGKIDAYQKKHKLTFDSVVPILRGGAIPATIIANHFGIGRMLPVHMGYRYNGKDTSVKQRLTLPRFLEPLPPHPTFLICETNTRRGRTATATIALLRRTFPTSTLYYATVARAYGGPETFEGIEEYFYGIQTNELFAATDAQCKKLTLRPRITLFPWEDPVRELAAVNG